MNIAIVSPNKNAYSETFIQVQKNNLKGNIFYYYDGQIPKKLENHGSILIKHFYLKRKLGLIGKNLGLESLKYSLKKHKIDVVLAQYGTTGNAICHICKELDIALVTHFHGYDISIKNVIKRNKNYSDAFTISKKIIAVSKEMEVDLKNLGCPQKKIIYNPCAPNNLFLNLKLTPKEKNKFISVGRFTDKKAPYFTILAFEKVLQVQPDAKLVLVGGGELLNTCVNLVQHIGIKNSVIFKGIINSEELVEEFKDSIAYVQHSIQALNGDKEGTPVAILEASASGLPVISTKHAGIRDVIKNNETGLLCNEGDVDQMAKNMIYLCENPDVAFKMGMTGRKNIQENFSLSRHIDTLNEVLINAVNSK